MLRISAYLDRRLRSSAAFTKTPSDVLGAIREALQYSSLFGIALTP